MALRLLALLQYFIVLALAWRRVAPQAVEGTALQQLGLLMNLPMDRPQLPMQLEDTPDFVRDVYNCLNMNGTKSINCVPGYHGSDVNKFRTSLGVGKLLPET